MSGIFEGSLVALVTPFRDGAVDREAVGKLTRMQVDGGTNAIVISGTTGESPTLTESEREELIRLVKEAADGALSVVAGTGSNNTAHVVESSKRALRAGADGLLVVTPYYNKPTQAGLLAHYRAVADAVDLPICLYSVPGRTGVAIAPETVGALAVHPNVAALKEAGGSVDRVSEIRQLTDLPILSGDDPLTLPMMAVGACGVVSVTANVAPGPVAELVSLAAKGDFAGALRAHDRLYALHRAMFLETNPTPVKAALALMGLVAEEYRLPLVPPSDRTRERLAEVLRRYALID